MSELGPDASTAVRGAATTERARKRRIRRVIALGMLAVEVGMGLSRGVRFGRNTVVRCRRGHLFATIWVPGASVKALRLGWWRVQRCPVGPHWSLVSPVGAAELTEDDRRAAIERHDLRIP
jgi:hypothetical protein